ncbi:uncharacterized protein BJ212DRAFT_1479523 [Suillus subaureus]|uniref:Uncharacterized protein n=1 Tax=Suillus subaureus TaxID=48587 RepID=A0A9P7EE62_9AGAM|nr:uncharacterized protein BJ212DRAFT_1479523 [Suillus subaureus]KAG1818515.1 hypothetical protein BJ212DRAFT_1479523 [Suillus subaureus]
MSPVTRGSTHKLGPVMCDNAANNRMAMEEFAQLYEVKHHKVFPWTECKINCLAHVINLATQTLIATYSKALHYNLHDLKGHEPTTQDEIGLIQSICVKEMYRSVQIKAGVSQPTQLLIDMKVQWLSMYIMLNCAKANKEHGDTFVYKIGHQECNLAKHMKIDFLQLSMAEWTCTGQFVDLLSYADVVQQAFSSECSSTLHLTILALETPYKAWSSCAERLKYLRFATSLQAPGPSSLMELEELDDAELEAGSDLKTAGDDGDDEDSWDIMLDDVEDNADDEADDEVSDFEMD